MLYEIVETLFAYCASLLAQSPLLAFAAVALKLFERKVLVLDRLASCEGYLAKSRTKMFNKDGSRVLRLIEVQH